METLLEKKLINGVVLTFKDGSKKMVGDRWLVKLQCCASIPMDKWMKDEISGSDQESIFIREQLGDTLSFNSDFERVFVEDFDKGIIISELIKNAEDNLLKYLEKETFAVRLFLKKIEEVKNMYKFRPRISETAEAEDETGPADFSDCFK